MRGINLLIKQYQAARAKRQQQTGRNQAGGVNINEIEISAKKKRMASVSGSVMALNISIEASSMALW